MPSADTITTQLDKIDWNFTSVQTPKYSIHSIHYFPGNFILQIPNYLMNLLSEPGDTILDPFCGSGTTGIESILQDRNACMFDNNEMAILISQAKQIILSYSCLYDDINTLISHLFWDDVIGSHNIANNALENSEYLVKWYHPQTLRQLIFIWDQISKFSNTKSYIVFQTIFSDLLFACTSTKRQSTSSGGVRRHHWGWVADNVAPKELTRHNAIETMKQKLLNVLDIISRHSKDNLGTFSISHGDCRNLPLEDDTIDCIITSPPYISMIDYTMANRMFYTWMDWDLNKTRNDEIGARYKRFRKYSFTEYLKDIDSCCFELNRVLKPTKYCAIIIGASRKYPHALDEVVGIFKNHFQLIWGPTLRQTTRSRLRERKGSAASEAICVFQKN